MTTPVRRPVKLGSISKAGNRYLRQLLVVGAMAVRVIGSDLKTEAIANLIEDWNREYDPDKSTLILTHRRGYCR